MNIKKFEMVVEVHEHATKAGTLFQTITYAVRRIGEDAEENICRCSKDDAEMIVEALNSYFSVSGIEKE